MSENDRVVMKTNDDATWSKMSLTQFGYITDPLISLFAQGYDHTVNKRAPIINRGYFARVQAIHDFARDFITTFSAISKKIQIVSLGAGYDTFFWNLKSELTAKGSDIQLCYVEVDFPQVVEEKSTVIQKHSELLSVLKSPSFYPSPAVRKVSSEEYYLLSLDLRSEELWKPELETLLDPLAPTLFLSECVLIYLEAAQSKPIVEWSARYFEHSAIVIYEQILPSDAFGKTMVSNLKLRGCPLLSIHDYPTLKSQRERFMAAGYSLAVAFDMNQIYQRIPRDEKQRIERIERFDEFEEWVLILAHYCIAIAVKTNNQPLDGERNTNTLTTAESSPSTSSPALVNSPEETAFPQAFTGLCIKWNL